MFDERKRLKRQPTNRDGNTDMSRLDNSKVKDELKIDTDFTYGHTKQLCYNIEIL